MEFKQNPWAIATSSILKALTYISYIIAALWGGYIFAIAYWYFVDGDYIVIGFYILAWLLIILVGYGIETFRQSIIKDDLKVASLISTIDYEETVAIMFFVSIISGIIFLLIK